MNKGATTLTFTDITDPDYVGTEQFWEIQVSPVDPATTQLAYIDPSSGSNGEQIGNFANTVVTVTALGPDFPAVPATPNPIIVDATGYANFSFTPIAASNITYQASYPGDNAWNASTTTLNEIGAG